MSSYHLNKVWSTCQHVESHCDLELWQIDLKINRDHLHPKTPVCAKFDKPRSILCLVIIRTRFGLYQYVDGQCDLDLWPINLLINRDYLHPKTHICAKFDKPRSILCLVIIRTRFGLYVNMLKVTVTLTFDLKINRDHLHPETYVCAKFDKPRSILCLVIIRTRFGLYQYVSHCDLDLWPIDLKINGDHLHPKTYVCAKFDKPMLILCLVIIRTRFGVSHNYVDYHCDLNINRNHLHPKTHVCAKFDKPRSILCLVIIRTRFGLYQYVGHCDLDVWPIDLKIDRDHLHPKTHVCVKFDKPRSILCLVIIWTR